MRLKNLAAQLQLLEDRRVAIEVRTLQIIEELTTTGGHCDQTTAGVEVLAVVAQVLGEVLHPCGEQGDLYFAGTGVLFIGTEFFDDRCFINTGIL